MAFAILDTNVYIDFWLGRIPDAQLAEIRRRFVVRQSAVVLSELWRGARDKRAQRLVSELRDLATLAWAPTVSDWWTAGELVRAIGDAQGWEIGKRREVQNDALIALTARHHGATVVTTNAGDFELLAGRIRPLQVQNIARHD